MTKIPTLHLICGQAGAGKTTFAKKLALEQDAIRFSKDEWIVQLYGRNLTSEQWSEYELRCYSCIESIAKTLLRRGLDVILDYGFWYEHERTSAARLASESGSHCIVHYLNTPTELRRERVLNRNQSLANNSVQISEEDFKKQIIWFQVPTDEEGIEIKITGINN